MSQWPGIPVARNIMGAIVFVEATNYKTGKVTEKKFSITDERLEDMKSKLAPFLGNMEAGTGHGMKYSSSISFQGLSSEAFVWTTCNSNEGSIRGAHTICMALADEFAMEGLDVGEDEHKRLIKKRDRIERGMKR